VAQGFDSMQAKAEAWLGLVSRFGFDGREMRVEQDTEIVSGMGTRGREGAEPGYWSVIATRFGRHDPEAHG